MKKLFRLLLLSQIIPAIIIILYFSTKNQTEWFNGADFVFSIFVNLSEAYIASFIFFVLINYLPWKKGNHMAMVDVDIVFSKLDYNIKGLINYLLHFTNYKYNDDFFEYDNNLKLPPETQFDFNKPNTTSIFVGSNFVIFDESVNVLKVIESIIVEINHCIDCLNDYQQFHNVKLIDISLSIKNSDLLDTLRCITSNQSMSLLGKLLNLRIIEINTFILLYRNFKKYLKKNNISIDMSDLHKKYEKTSRKYIKEKHLWINHRTNG